MRSPTTYGILFTITSIITSCNDGGGSKNVGTDSTGQNFDFIKPDNKEKIAVLKDSFSPKEVYFEIARRVDSAKFDTLLPPSIKLNYTKEEVLYIKKKAKDLLPLSNEDLLSLYQSYYDGRKVIYGADDREDVIYGVDNINDVSGTENPFMRDGVCVIALIPKTNMSKNSSGNYIIHPKGSFQNRYKLCETERFLEQPVIASCSGFAVASDKIATAGHCVKDSNYKNFYYVFDLMMNPDGTFNPIIPAKNVYEGTQLVGFDLYNSNKEDYAVIRLNRRIDNYRIAKINSSSTISATMQFHVIGTPCGLPLKIATNANLRDNTNPYFFVIASDTYGGNSGSPVFNSNTHEVEGILVRGENDFSERSNFSVELPTKKCFVSVICPFNGCRGEDVSRKSQFIKYINR